MSQFMPDQPAERQPSTPAKGPEEYLAPEERKFLARYLSFPEDIPPKFKSWLIDFIAVNIPQIPISQIVGFTQFTATSAEVGTSETTSSTSFTDLATVGPTIPGVSAGQYLFFLGGRIHRTAGAGLFAGLMAPSVNGAAASDTEAAVFLGDDEASVSRVLSKRLTQNSNEIKLKYRVVAGTYQFQSRWLVVLKVGN